MNAAPPVLCGLCGREAGREDPIDARPAFYAEVAPALPPVIALVGDPEAVSGSGLRAHTVRRFTVDGLMAFQRKTSPWEATHQACGGRWSLMMGCTCLGRWGPASRGGMELAMQERQQQTSTQQPLHPTVLVVLVAF